MIPQVPSDPTPPLSTEERKEIQEQEKEKFSSVSTALKVLAAAAACLAGIGATATVLNSFGEDAWQKERQAKQEFLEGMGDVCRKGIMNHCVTVQVPQTNYYTQYCLKDLQVKPESGPATKDAPGEIALSASIPKKFEKFVRQSGQEYNGQPFLENFEDVTVTIPSDLEPGLQRFAPEMRTHGNERIFCKVHIHLRED